MNHTVHGPLALALATAVLSASSCTAPSSNRALKTGPSATKKVAFHVIGLMKTESGAT